MFALRLMAHEWDEVWAIIKRHEIRDIAGRLKMAAPLMFACDQWHRSLF